MPYWCGTIFQKKFVACTELAKIKKKIDDNSKFDRELSEKNWDKKPSGAINKEIKI